MASGDLKYMEVVSGVVLSGADRTALGNIVANYWAGALADLAEATFYRRPDGTIGCVLRGEQTKAPANVPFGVTVTGRVP